MNNDEPDLPQSDLAPHLEAARAAVESLIRDEHNPVEP
jgi:hypothetical protein